MALRSGSYSQSSEGGALVRMQNQEMKQPPSICLAVIHGNEEAVIERFIREFAPAVEFMVFVRAIGNQVPDRTAQIIGETCEQLDVPYVRQIYENQHDFEHVDNFGAARQMAWDLASKTKADYLMWADCDDLLAEDAAEAIRDVALLNEHDCLLMPYQVKGRSQTVMRERMVRNDGCSRWRYPIHEQLAFNRDVTYHILREGIFIHSPLQEKRDQSPRNLNILEAQVQEIARYYFYISQEFFGRHDIPRFKKFAKAALAAPGLEDVEKYEIHLNMAQCSSCAEAREHAAQAFEIMPDRREALALLASYAIVDGDNQKAYQLAKMMMGIPKPKKSYWNLNNDWYEWKGLHLYCQTLRLTGQSQEADGLEGKLFKESNAIFSIVHATLGRVQAALAMREQWFARADNPLGVEYIFGLHAFDQDSMRFLKGFRHSETDNRGAGPNLEAAAAISTGSIIIQAQDDIIPPMHWDTLLLEKLKDVHIGKDPIFVTVSDGHRKDRIHVTSIMSRTYMNQKAAGDCSGCGFGHPGYFSMYWDTENSYRAYRDARDGKCKLVNATDLIFFHDHPAFVKNRPWDETYKIENAPEHYKAGLKLFRARNPMSGSDGIMEGA